MYFVSYWREKDQNQHPRPLEGRSRVTSLFGPFATPLFHSFHVLPFLFPLSFLHVHPKYFIPRSKLFTHNPTSKMAFITHPQMSTYPGASFQTPWNPSNYNGPHLAQRSGGHSQGYWAHVPWEVPEPTPWGLPPAVTAAMEGRGTGVWGMTMQGGGQPFNYGWPKYGPVCLIDGTLTGADCRCL